MFSIQVKLALRNLMKNKLLSFINLTGFSLGLTCTILILLWVRYEINYDKFHVNHDRIYRVLRPDDIMSSRTPYQLADILHENLSEIKHTVRLSHINDRTVSYKNNLFIEKDFVFTDPDIFSVFTFPFIHGNPITALTEPFSLVLTESMAYKYFVNENPIGKRLRVDNKYDYNITGVIKDVPPNSHFKFDFLATFVGSDDVFFSAFFDLWYCQNIFTYVLLEEKCQSEVFKSSFDQRMKDLLAKVKPDVKAEKYELQPLKQAHLYSADFKWDIAQQGNITHIYIFSAIALFILLIACINYINISTAQASKRSVEFCVKKIVGSSGKHIIFQFLTESFMYILIASLFSILLVELCLPTFNSIIGSSISLFAKENVGFFFILIGIVLGVTIISASYPALLAFAVQPVSMLKGYVTGRIKDKHFRHGLVVIQFAISTSLILGVLIVISQFHFLRTKQLGFNKEQLLIVHMPRSSILRQDESFKNRLLQHHNITHISTAERVPPKELGVLFTFKSLDSGIKKLIYYINIDYNYFETLGAPLRAGRTYSPSFSTDIDKAVMLNTSAANELGIKDPVGKIIKSGMSGKEADYKIIGVVEDFHFESLYNKIKPMIFRLNPNNGNLVLRIKSTDIPETIDFVKKNWQSLFPAWVFEYYFVDESFDQQYRKDMKVGQIVKYFTILSIIIASLGLFGLAAFSAEQRTKEIGIRKTLGASILEMVVLLTKDFTKYVLLANIIAWPVAWYVMNKWLQDFAYKIEITIWPFLLAGILALVNALLTVSYQAIKAATKNPVEALRYE